MKKVTPLFLVFMLAFRLTSVAQYSWTNIGFGMDSPVLSLASDTTNNILYAGGIFTLADGLPAVGIAKWTGTSWSPLGSGIVSGTVVSSMIMQGTDLIAAGTFTNIGGILSKNIARWDGSAWAGLGAGLDNIGLTSVNALAIYNGELYAGGLFSNSGGTALNYIAKWDGTNWQPLSTGTNGAVKALCVYNNELYAGGTFTDAGGVAVKNIARWNGSVWSDVGGGLEYTGATTVSTMKNFGSLLYVGGTFNTAGGSTSVNNIASWNGATWSDVGGGTQYTGATTVSTMLNFNSALIVGGTFDSLGTTGSNYVGAWDGAAWSSLGSGTNSSVLALESLHDTLYAAGLFTMADGNITPFIAQWSPSTATAITTSIQEIEFPPLRVFPNPVQNHLFIKENTAVISKNTMHTFQLYNLIGKKVLEEKNVKEEIYFDRSVILPGLYIYRIIDMNGKEISQGKLSFK